MSTTTNNHDETNKSFLSQVEIYGHKELVDKFSKITREDIDRLSSSKNPHNRYSISVAKTHEAQKLNRYTDVIPFDYNRVKLSTKRPSKTDYINASFIEAPNKVRRYIAAQGPLQETIDDFWLMVWEQNSRVIVMLTKEIEKGSPKCIRYWPSQKDQPIESSVTGLKVSLESETLDPDTSCWPDHGVPDSPDIVLQLIRKTNELQQEYQNRQNIGRNDREKEEVGPVVVHCSAGCGRTGTFCTIDSALALLQDMHDKSSDLIYSLVQYFREQRTHMVQTLSQYQYCYLVVLRKLALDSGSVVSSR
ncbi:4295_t:CDS:2 [Ambispora leptoticha]|uniref:4295_t:CDS:1 n=1 Tax=Ambispora leptoticha TaxID=144679 RepID=A0A9N8ZME9_9GLOM|nr:4295_t:CDS:2 [Ambispora leptoticha]